MESLVRITIRNQTFKFQPGRTLMEVLAELDIEPESVLAIREGQLISAEFVLKEGDEIKLVPVISGGGKVIGQA